MQKFKNDLTGKKFNNLIVENYSGQGRWKCICDCGREIEVKSNSLTSGHTKSCGCLKNKHNKCNTRLYTIFSSMKQRCYNKKHKEYDRYGGRGIRILSEWLNDFRNFYKWAMENGYKDNLTIDRIDNDGNYCPDNCRWITLAQQQQTKSTCRFYKIGEYTHNLTEWAKIFGIKYKTVNERINNGWDVLDALTIPINQKKLNKKYRKDNEDGIKK